MTALPLLETPEAYETALKEVSRLVDVDPDPQSEEGKRFEALIQQVLAYETLHYPI